MKKVIVFVLMIFVLGITVLPSMNHRADDNTTVSTQVDFGDVAGPDVSSAVGVFPTRKL